MAGTPPRVARAAGRALVLAAALLSSAGCGLAHLQDLNFSVDDRLHFTSPPARTLVRQPVTVRWTIRDFTVARPGSAPPSKDAGYFAIFVDRAPIKPEQTMKVEGQDDPACKHNPKCPDRTYLANRQIYTTTATRFRLPQIPSLSTDREKEQVHTITIVLMDTAGHRIGESAWELDIRLPRVGV